jgi:hypothetical protein
MMICIVMTSLSCKLFSSADQEKVHLTSVCCGFIDVTRNPRIENAWGPKHISQKRCDHQGGSSQPQLL